MSQAILLVRAESRIIARKSRDFKARDICAISLEIPYMLIGSRATSVLLDSRAAHSCLLYLHQKNTFFEGGRSGLAGLLRNFKNRKVNLKGESGYTGRLRKLDGREEQMDSRDGQMDGTGGWTVELDRWTEIGRAHV